MTLEELESLGFYVVAGQIDYKNVNYGYLTKEGPVLTDAGKDVVAALKTSAAFTEKTGTTVEVVPRGRGRPTTTKISDGPGV